MKNGVISEAEEVIEKEMLEIEDAKREKELKDIFDKYPDAKEYVMKAMDEIKKELQ